MRIQVLDPDLYAEDDLKPKHPGDAGVDLRLAGTVAIPPGSTAKVGLGVAIELPMASCGWITSRSSAALQRNLLIHEGKIDEGYRGEVHAIVTNLSQHHQTVARGEKLCQLLVLKIIAPEHWLKAEELGETQRGSDGFGSTG